MQVMFRYMMLCFFFQTTIAVTSPYLQLILRNKGYSYSLVGVMLAVGQIASIIFPVIFTMLSDKTRRTKSIVIILLIVSVCLYIPAALCGSVVLTFIIFFAAMGAYKSINPTLDGYLNRMLDGDPARYSLARSSGTMGYVVTLAIFGLINYPDVTDNRSMCTCLVIVSLIFLVVMCFAPKDRPLEEEDPSDVSEGKRKPFEFGRFSHKFYLMMLAAGLTRVAQAVPDHLLSSYMTEVLGLGDNFSLFVALGALAEFFMMIFGGYLLHKGKTTPYTLILLSAIALVVRMLIYYFIPSIPGLLLGQLLHSMTFGAYHIAITRFISQTVRHRHYSQAMGFYWAVATNLPQLLGSLLGGVVIDHFGYPFLFLSFAVFPLISVVICLAKGTYFKQTTERE